MVEEGRFLGEEVLEGWAVLVVVVLLAGAVVVAVNVGVPVGLARLLAGAHFLEVARRGLRLGFLLAQLDLLGLPDLLLLDHLVEYGVFFQFLTHYVLQLQP